MGDGCPGKAGTRAVRKWGLMAKAVKMADIAKVMGVSTVTVSKALSDQKGVSEELRIKIKKKAE